MKDPFLDKQWRELKERLRRSASHIAGSDQSLATSFGEQADAFAHQKSPERYQDFLDRVREAARLAVQWQEQREETRVSPDKSNGADAQRGDLASRDVEPVDDESAWTGSTA